MRVLCRHSSITQWYYIWAGVLKEMAYNLVLYVSLSLCLALSFHGFWSEYEETLLVQDQVKRIQLGAVKLCNLIMSPSQPFPLVFPCTHNVFTL